MVLPRLEKKLGIPPLQDITKILSGEGGKRIESILLKLDKLSDDQEVLVGIRQLLEAIHEMDQTGELDKLDSILKSLPKGKSGATMIAQVKEILDGLDKKIEKLTQLANDIMSRED